MTIQEQINTELSKLQQELEKIDSAVQMVKQVADTGQDIAEETSKLHLAYQEQLDNITEIYKETIVAGANELNQTAIAVQEKLKEVKHESLKLFIKPAEKLKNLTADLDESAVTIKQLVTALDAVDFPQRLSTIEAEMKALGSEQRLIQYKGDQHYEKLLASLNESRQQQKEEATQHAQQLSAFAVANEQKMATMTKLSYGLLVLTLLSVVLHFI